MTDVFTHPPHIEITTVWLVGVIWNIFWHIPGIQQPRSKNCTGVKYRKPFEIIIKCLILGSTFFSDDLVFVPEGHPAMNRFLENRHCLFVTILIYIFISRGFREVFFQRKIYYVTYIFCSNFDLHTYIYSSGFREVCPHGALDRETAFEMYAMPRRLSTSTYLYIK